MRQEKDIKDAIEKITPSIRSAEIKTLAHIISRLVDGKLTISLAQEQILQNNALQSLLKELSGKTVETKEAILSFGEQSQVGDIVIRDVATNITHINIYLPRHKSDDDESQSAQRDDIDDQAAFFMPGIYFDMYRDALRRGGTESTIKELYIGRRIRWQGIIQGIILNSDSIWLGASGIVARILPGDIKYTTYGIRVGTVVLIKGKIENIWVSERPSYPRWIKLITGNGDSSGLVTLSDCIVEETAMSSSQLPH